MIHRKESVLNDNFKKYKQTFIDSRQGIEDVIVSMAPQMVTLLAGLITSVLLARNLGPGEMGEYALILSVTGFVAVASDLGIYQTALRFASRSAALDDKPGLYAVLRWAFRIRMLLVNMAVLAVFIVAPYICENIWSLKELTPLLRVSLLISIFTVISSIPTVYLQSLKRFKMNAIVTIVQTSITLIGIILITAFDRWSLGSVIATSIVANLIGAFMFINIVPKETFVSLEEIKRPFSFLKKFFQEPETSSVKTMDTMNPNRFLIYMVISTIIIAITARVDIWLLGFYLDKTQIGIYSVATYFTIPLSMLLNAIITAIWPRASAIRSYDDMIRFLRTTVFLSGLVMVCGIGYSLAMPLSIPMIFGTAYGSGILAGQLLCLGYCVALLMCPVVVIGYSFGMVRYYWLVNLLQLAIALALNIMLIPRIGIIAPALAFICYNSGGLIFNFIFIRSGMKKVDGQKNVIISPCKA